MTRAELLTEVDAERRVGGSPCRVTVSIGEGGEIVLKTIDANGTATMAAILSPQTARELAIGLLSAIDRCADAERTGSGTPVPG